MDDLVEQVSQALDEGKQLENTFVIFSSDNGYHLGKQQCITVVIPGSTISKCNDSD